MEAKKDLNAYILAWLIIAGFFTLTVYLLHLVHTGGQISDTTGSVFMLLGTVSTAFGIVVQYFFGSTKGSADKTAQLVEMAKTGDFSKPPCPPEVKDDVLAVKP
jgi:hypothetical protein